MSNVAYVCQFGFLHSSGSRDYQVKNIECGVPDKHDPNRVRFVLHYKGDRPLYVGNDAYRRGYPSPVENIWNAFFFLTQEEARGYAAKFPNGDISPDSIRVKIEVEDTIPF